MHFGVPKLLACKYFHVRVVHVVRELGPADQHFRLNWRPPFIGRRTKVSNQNATPRIAGNQHARVKNVVAGPTLEDDFLM